MSKETGGAGKGAGIGRGSLVTGLMIHSAGPIRDILQARCNDITPDYDIRQERCNGITQDHNIHQERCNSIMSSQGDRTVITEGINKWNTEGQGLTRGQNLQVCL